MRNPGNIYFAREIIKEILGSGQFLYWVKKPILEGLFFSESIPVLMILTFIRFGKRREVLYLLASIKIDKIAMI